MSKMPRSGTTTESDAAEIDSVLNDFSYFGIDTCAVDGLCATACPVNINTGDLTRRLRREAITPSGERIANWIAEHFSSTEFALGVGVRLGHVAEAVIGVNGVKAFSTTTEKITGKTLPKWNSHVPFATNNLHALSVPSGEKDFVYFPSCISRQLGIPAGDSHLKDDCHLSLAEALITISNRAGIHLQIPKDISGTCCGMPFHSKGYEQAYQITLHKTLMQMWEWSEQGKYPIVIDTTSCTNTLRICKDDLNADDKQRWQKLTILDSLEFLHDHVLPTLKIKPIDEDVVLHPNCSARKLGVDSKMVSIAQQCAKSATVPLNLGCCAFAGDRGLLFPELTEAATQKESAEVNAHEYGGYYSSNIPCEIGMSEATGKNYISVIYLVERASRM
jgi:D-lactate dehydrogenase